MKGFEKSPPEQGEGGGSVAGMEEGLTSQHNPEENPSRAALGPGQEMHLIVKISN